MTHTVIVEQSKSESMNNPSKQSTNSYGSEFC